MKFKRGSRVEVLSNKDPLGAWRCAEIVVDNGDSYTVRYYRCLGVAKDGVNKVTAEAIRPCPRQVVALENLGVGDVVEVLDDGFWRASVIEEVMEDDYYRISVIGSLDEFRVKKSSIRARQEWKEKKWITLDKDSESYWDLTYAMRKKSHVQPRQGKSLKRSSPDHGVIDKAYSKTAKKQRLVDKEIKLDVVHGDSYSFVGKVDNSANQRGICGKDDVQIFIEKPIILNKAKNGNNNVFPFLARAFDDDCVSTVSSVASCSFANAISDRLVSNSSASCSEDSDSLCSDAESCGYVGVEDDVCDGQLESGDSLRAHELDLHSYCRILQSLYVSGPLSWLQEIALTNLRMRLCVSNDEHLTELRRLKSIGDQGVVQTCKPYCHNYKDDVVANYLLCCSMKGESFEAMCAGCRE